MQPISHSQHARRKKPATRTSVVVSARDNDLSAFVSEGQRRSPSNPGQGARNQDNRGSHVTFSSKRPMDHRSWRSRVWTRVHVGQQISGATSVSTSEPRSSHSRTRPISDDEAREEGSVSSLIAKSKFPVSSENQPSMSANDP